MTFSHCGIVGRRRWRNLSLVVAAMLGLAMAMRCASYQQATEQVSVSTSAFNASAQPPEFAGSECPWATFTAPDRDFSVEMPGQPSQVSDSVSTPIGAQHVTRFKVSAAGCDFDAGYLQRSSNPLAKLVGESAILKSACEGTASHMHGRLATSTALTIDGEPARDILVHLNDDDSHIAMARLMITDDRIYHVIVRMPAEASTSQQDAAHRFIESLHLKTIAAAVR